MRMRSAFILLGLAAAGCGGAHREREAAPLIAAAPSIAFANGTPPREVAPPAKPGGTCPARSPAVHVGAQRLERGAALVFATKDDIAGLRAGLRASPAWRANDVEPHADVVRGGVRFVYEASSRDEAAGLRAVVEGLAHEIASRCNLSYGLLVREEVPAAAAPDPTAAAPAASASPAPAPSSSAAAPTKPPDKNKDAKPPAAKPSKEDPKKASACADKKPGDPACKKDGETKPPPKDPKAPPKEPPKPPDPPPLPPPPRMPTPPKL